MRFLRPLLLGTLLLLAGGVLLNQLSQLSLDSLLRHLLGLQSVAVATALCLVASNFLVGGLYEGVMLRTVGVHLGIAQPLRAAFIANSIGHCLGWTVLTGGALRWRLYQGHINKAQVAAMLPLTAMPFALSAWALLSIAAIGNSVSLGAALHIPALVLKASGVVGLALFGVLAIVVHNCRALSLWKRRVPLPATRMILLQLLTGTIEIAVVAGVLYCLLPASLHMDFFHFISTYLVAVLLGLMSSVPAGLGVLEASLLVLLPQVPPDELVASIAAYRLLFEVLPFACGCLMLLVRETTLRQSQRATDVHVSDSPRTLES